MKKNAIKEIDSKIAQLQAWIKQLDDENYYCKNEKKWFLPRYESQLKILEQERERAVRGIEVFDEIYVTANV